MIITFRFIYSALCRAQEAPLLEFSDSIETQSKTYLFRVIKHLQRTAVILRHGAIRRLTPGFQHYVAVAVSISVTVSVKTCLYLQLLLGRVRGNSAAGPGGRPPSLPRKRMGGAPGAYEVTNGRYGKIELVPI